MIERLGYEEVDHRLGELEKALKESEERYLSLFKNNHSIMMLIDPENARIIDANQAAVSFYGWTHEEITQKKISDINILSEELVLQEIEQAKKELRNQFYFRHKTSEGEVRDVEVVSGPIILKGRKILYSIVHDISVKKRYEDGLKQIALDEPYQFGEKFFNSLVIKLSKILNANYTFIGELSLDKKSVRTISLCINGEIAENFEYELRHTPCENVVGQDICSYQKNVASLFPKDLLLDQMGVDGYVGVPLFNKKNKPSGILVALYKTQIKDIFFAESFLQLVASQAAAEIERTNTEEALRVSENRFRDISMSMADWIWEIDLQGKFKYVSENVIKILGYSYNELIGKTIFEYRDEKEVERIKKQFHNIITSKQSFDNLENWNVDIDGHPVCILTSGIPILDNEGNLVGYRGVSKDITVQKKLETEKELAEADLRQALKMEAVGTISGGIAHDFNNILGIIIGNIELAMDDISEGNRSRKNLEEVKIASLRARDVVSQLLTFSRKTIQTKRAIEIKPIIKESIKLLRSSIPSSIDIQLDLSVTSSLIVGDHTQIHQIIINLCTNAAHAMEEEGGILGIGLSLLDIDGVAVSQYKKIIPGKYIQLSISDTGHGIDEKTKTKIFDPYFTTKGVGKGTGLGLSVVLGIVKSHNGEVLVYSEPEKGSIFKVLFPLLDKKKDIYSHTNKEIPKGTESILFVDDEEALTQLGQTMLEGLGYTVEVENNPLNALKKFKDNPSKFDLIITDMTMPHMTGDQLIQNILKINPDISIILSTGFNNKIDMEKALSIGANQYIEKPFTRRKLARVIRASLLSRNENDVDT